jgi:hypothetical protein
MSQLKQTFNKSAASYLKEYWGVAAVSLGALALVADLLVLPSYQADDMKRKLDEAIQANDGIKVEQVLKHRHAKGMWSGVFEDEHGNEKRQFLAQRLCDATKHHSAAAIDAILKNDPDPYQHIIRHEGNFIPIKSNYVYQFDSERSCSFAQAIRNGDVKSVEAYIANGLYAKEQNELAAIGQSKEMIDYFLQNPGKMAFGRNANRGEAAQHLLLAHLVSTGAPVGNVRHAIERIDLKGGDDGYAGRHAALSLRTAIKVAGDTKRAGYGLTVIDALLKKGVSANTSVVDDDSGYGSRQSALLYSLRNGSSDATKRLLQAGADADAALQALVKDNVNPYRLQGWDASVTAAATQETRDLLAVADQQRNMLERLKKAPAPGT